MFNSRAVIEVGLWLIAIAVGALLTNRFAQGRRWLRLLSGVVAIGAATLLGLLAAVVVLAVLLNGGDY